LCKQGTIHWLEDCHMWQSLMKQGESKVPAPSQLISMFGVTAVMAKACNSHQSTVHVTVY